MAINTSNQFEEKSTTVLWTLFVAFFVALMAYAAYAAYHSERYASTVPAETSGLVNNSTPVPTNPNQ